MGWVNGFTDLVHWLLISIVHRVAELRRRMVSGATGNTRAIQFLVGTIILQLFHVCGDQSRDSPSELGQLLRPEIAAVRADSRSDCYSILTQETKKAMVSKSRS